jgi:hypothetical protein
MFAPGAQQPRRIAVSQVSSGCGRGIKARRGGRSAAVGAPTIMES